MRWTTSRLEFVGGPGNKCDGLCTRGIDSLRVSIHHAKSYKYGYPIYKWATFVEEFFNSENGINVLIPDNGTASPKTAIIGPNVDVIYSNALFDISAHDLIITVPEIDAGRYWSFAFYSA
jgi:hypothetical protein